MSPAEFIPVAEEVGLIADIGAWVLRRACADAAAWPSHISVSVNVSPLQLLSSAFPNLVGDALAKGRLSPNRLELEVTRSEEHTSELQSLMRISYAVFCLKK